MKKSKFGKFLYVAFVIAVSFILFSACGEKENRGYDDSLISPEWYSEKTGRKSGLDYTKEYVIDSGKTSIPISGYPVLISVEDMVQRSALVIRGRVLGFDYLCIESADGTQKMPHTDYYVEILDVLRGEPYDDKMVTVRSMGGEDNDEILNIDNFELTVGQEYILFLWMPSKGGTWFHTEGDYYGIVEIETTVFEASDETTRNADGITVPKTFKPTYPSDVNNEDLDYLEFKEKMKEYNEIYPVVEDYEVSKYKEGLEANLESGFITKEEYDNAMSIIGDYGTILYYTEPEGA